MKREATQKINKKENVQTKPLRELFEDKQTRMRVTSKRAYTIFGWLNSISVLFNNKFVIFFIFRSFITFLSRFHYVSRNSITFCYLNTVFANLKLYLRYENFSLLYLVKYL